ncbi:MAG: DNA polymerase ligase N-terminal domain-containing protein, partial [Candidatus Limnocylindrales bacterium]
MTLERYKQKRDFGRTPEPVGAPPRPGTDERGGGRFAVQRHRATRLHYDLRLEIDGVLMSWAVPKGPTLDPAARRMAVHVEDHPLEYFDFEGTIPRGEYGAGDVIVWDWGRFEPEATSDPGAAVRAGELKFRLAGEKLRGSFVLVRTRRGGAAAGGAGGSGRDDREDWLLIKHRDGDARPGWDPETHPRSVRTGRTNDEVKADAPAIWRSDAPNAEARIDLQGAAPAAMPDWIEPMKATLADAPFDDPDWLFELKLDGYRVEAVVRDGAVRLWTRNRQDAAAYFPELARRPRWIEAREAIVDGEVVALDQVGTPRFTLLQGRLRNVSPAGSGGGGPAPAALSYQVFDLLYLDGRSLLGVPLEERKRLLQLVLRDDPLVTYPSHVIADGVAF